MSWYGEGIWGTKTDTVQGWGGNWLIVCILITQGPAEIKALPHLGTVRTCIELPSFTK